MIPAGQALIGSAALAAELGIAPCTLCHWAKAQGGKPAIAAAKWSRGRFLVQPLRDAGVLPRIGGAA